VELFDENEFSEYVRQNYQCLFETDNPFVESEISGTCDVCQREAFLKVHSSANQGIIGWNTGMPTFVTYFIECPRCRRKSILTTVRLTKDQSAGKKDINGKNEIKKMFQIFRLFRLPTGEEAFINKDIPAEYASLKNAVAEATYCLAHSKNIAAAILFRRAIQILTKDILGASGKTLHSQLEWLKVNKNKMGIDLVDVFHDNAKIIKDSGNQGAHPDDDITLHVFTKEDAEGLHDLFISIVHEVFVKPAKIKSLQEELKKNRKLV